MTLVASRRPFGLLIFIALSLMSGAGKAFTPPSAFVVTPPSDEESLVAQGIELREKGDDEGALSSFRRAYDVSKGARPLAQVGLAEQALGRWVEAELHLGEAVTRVGDTWILRNKTLLESALADIQGHIGSLDLSGGVVGADVRVNGASVGTLPLKAPIRVPAGSIALEVNAPGYIPVARAVMVPGRGLARESIVLVGAPTLSPPPPVPEAAPLAMGAPPSQQLSPRLPEEPSGSSTANRWSGRKKAALALEIGAAVGLTVGTSFLFIRNSRAKDFNNNSAGCTTADTQPPDVCKSLQDQVHSALTVGVVGLAGAVVLGTVGTYLLLTEPSGNASAVAIAPAPRYRCLPGLGTAIACAGEF